MSFAISGWMGAGQERFSRGQNIAPSFEGWEENSDGSFNMVFGYLNRNYEEKLDIPIGPNNNIEPGGPDRGQPTHFLPRRNRFVFRVTVPKDFRKGEIVWTITAHGKTEKAFATLIPEYVIDQETITLNNSELRGSFVATNKAPIIRVEAETRRATRVGDSLTLNTFASDDGWPLPRPAPPVALGLRVAWFVYRGQASKVIFSPEQFKVYPDFESDSPWASGWTPPQLPTDGRMSVKVTFGAPGVYVLRVMAHDGALESTQDVTVTVEP